MMNDYWHGFAHGILFGGLIANGIVIYVMERVRRANRK